MYADPPSRAYDGHGSARNGQRWNAKGLRAAYASATLSLAALEYVGTLVDINDAPNDLVAIAAEIDERVVEILDESSLPGWDATPPDVSVRFGSEWLRRRRTAVLSVPSVLVRSERNYVINPEHEDFPGTVRVLSPEPFELAAILRRLPT